ncbi:vesicle-associated membrane protein 5 isoform X2 [Phyllobates terribilis]|uniref:vesicle-associated membrane protein 5 isoform X2 n=1 Tax=Phyllobates terribilis TaxID=111132 RepID=UPI003CCA9397
MASQKLEQCQRNAEEVKILMKDNVDKIFEREGKLDNLEVRADELKDMAMSFQKTAQTVERKTYWEKWRWYFICVGIISLAVIIIIVIIAVQFSGGGSEEASPAEERSNDQNEMNG